MRLTVGIATNGRLHVLKQSLQYLVNQSQLPDELIVCTASIEKLPSDLTSNAPFPIRHVTSELGLTKQRNRILHATRDCDVILFMDDDFFACYNYIAETLRVFEDGSVAVATGTVLADGIKGPGISFAEADTIIQRDSSKTYPLEVKRIVQGYGCNMALRYQLIADNQLLFDENLPRYGWYEDVDMMRRLATHGDVVRMTAARGVHLGTKVGRSSGRFLGYSQVANPIYLHRKGIYLLSETITSVARNLAANMAKSIAPESFIDRRGRLYGNLVGLKDLLEGNLHPMNALRMDGAGKNKPVSSPTSNETNTGNQQR